VSGLGVPARRVVDGFGALVLPSGLGQPAGRSKADPLTYHDAPRSQHAKPIPSWESDMTGRRPELMQPWNGVCPQVKHSRVPADH
jgi:hypothetical protein